MSTEYTVRFEVLYSLLLCWFISLIINLMCQEMLYAVSCESLIFVLTHFDLSLPSCRSPREAERGR